MSLCVCVATALCRMTFVINSLPALAIMTADSTHHLWICFLRRAGHRYPSWNRACMTACYPATLWPLISSNWPHLKVLTHRAIVRGAESLNLLFRVLWAYVHKYEGYSICWGSFLCTFKQLDVRLSLMIVADEGVVQNWLLGRYLVVLN